MVFAFIIYLALIFVFVCPIRVRIFLVFDKKRKIFGKVKIFSFEKSIGKKDVTSAKKQIGKKKKNDKKISPKWLSVPLKMIDKSDFRIVLPDEADDARLILSTFARFVSYFLPNIESRVYSGEPFAQIDINSRKNLFFIIPLILQTLQT